MSESVSGEVMSASSANPDLWADLSARLRRISPLFRLATGPQACEQAWTEASADPLGRYVAPADLIDVDTGVAVELLGGYAASRGMRPDRDAALLVFQRYAHRVAGVAVAAWLLDGIVVDVRAEACAILVRDGSPARLLLAGPSRLPGTDAETLVATVVDGHLLPVAEALRSVGGARMNVLWGSMGAAIAAACRRLSAHLPAEQVRVRGQALLVSRPRLETSGSFRILQGPKGQRLFFDRSTCCNWYAVRDGKHCSWCSRLSHDERTARFEKILAREASTRHLS